MSNVDSKVHLQQISVEGYRSCKATTFAPHAKLSALIGINGAGKTNLLNSIRLLSVRAGRVNSRIQDDEFAGNEAVVTAWFVVGVVRIGLRIKVRLSSSGRNSDEIVFLEEGWNLYALTGSRAWKAMPAFLMRDLDHLQLSKIDILNYQRHYFEYEDRYRGGSALNRREFKFGKTDFDLFENRDVLGAVSAIDEFRRGIAYYSASQFTDPTRCPSSFEIDGDLRLVDAYGASKAHMKFIHDLYRLRSANEDQYNDFVSFVSRAQLGLISRITWKEIELSSNTADVKTGGKISKIRKTKTLVIPKIQIGSSYITFNQLSEGTFKTLALVFYLMTDASSCLLIEEPEVCVHHGLLTRIISTIKAYSKVKQVVFSTHSDLVLDGLDPENVFVVEMLKSGTACTALGAWLNSSGKRALHAYLNESGTLGEYWRSGGLS